MVRHIWFMDQCRNPLESKQTIGEVLKWFDQNGVEFIKSIPKSRAFSTLTTAEKLFEPEPRPQRIDRCIVQLLMVLGDGWEGGSFTMIGRKKWNQESARVDHAIAQERLHFLDKA